MTGHVFLIRGDIRHLRCDAYLVVTDEDGNNPNDMLFGHPRASGAGVELTGIPAGQTRQVLAAHDAPAAPAVFAAAIPRSGSSDPKLFHTFLTAFVEQNHGERSGSTRPLLAIPFLGTGQAGNKSVNAQLIWQQLVTAHELAAKHHVDIAVVAFGGSASGHRMLSAALALRRDLAATDPSWWAPLTAGQRHLAARLAARARADQLVLFIGAGVSVSAGLDNWNGLLAALADQIPLEPALKQALTDQHHDPLDRAEVLGQAAEDHGRDLRDLVAERIRAQSRPALQHYQLTNLPVTELVTLNYDQLLETSARHGGEPLTVLPNLPAEREPWLLKLHGDVDDPSSIVLRREEYLAYAAERAALSGVVQALLITRHMLFVGFGMADPHFHSILHEVRSALRCMKAPGAVLGTALSVEDDLLPPRLWGKDVATETLLAEQGERRGRTLEIFLDLLVSDALPSANYLLDPTLSGLRTDRENTLATLLKPLAAALPGIPDSIARRRLVAALQGLGWSGI